MYNGILKIAIEKPLACSSKNWGVTNFLEELDIFETKVVNKQNFTNLIYAP